MERTSKQWYDSYLRWGGSFTICDPDGWDRKHWDYSWCKEKITAEEFLRRAAWSTLMQNYDRPHKPEHDGMTDLEYYFQIVCREENDI